MKFLKITIYISVFLGGFLAWQNAQAADYYIADMAAGEENGTNCDNAKALSYLTGSWSGKVNAGDTVHLCGILTSKLTIGGSGSQEGGDITIKFEDNAKFSSAAWGYESSAAIYSSGKDYITIDGGTNGIIENTNNGTALGTQQNSYGMYIALGSNWTIKNLTIKTIYVRTPDSSDSNAYGNGVVLEASNNIILDNLTISDMRFGVYFRTGNYDCDGLTIKDSSIKRVASAIAGGLSSAQDYTNVVVDNVTIDDLDVWDGTWNDGTSWHHADGIHFFAAGVYNDNYLQATIRNCVIGGNFSTHTTSWMYFEHVVSDLTIYNNILYATKGKPSGGYIGAHTYHAGTVNIYNNTIVGQGPTPAGGQGISLSRQYEGTWTVTIKNNLISNCYVGVYDPSNAVTYISDYNLIHNVDSIVVKGSTWYKTLAAWQGLGYDEHSLTDDPNLTASYYLPAGSPAINKAEDLSAVFTTDILGTTRPTGANTWDIGAYEYVGADDTTPPASPTGLSVS